MKVQELIDLLSQANPDAEIQVTLDNEAQGIHAACKLAAATNFSSFVTLHTALIWGNLEPMCPHYGLTPKGRLRRTEAGKRAGLPAEATAADLRIEWAKPSAS